MHKQTKQSTTFKAFKVKYFTIQTCNRKKRRLVHGSADPRKGVKIGENLNLLFIFSKNYFNSRY